MKVYTVSPCLLKRAISNESNPMRLILKFFTDSDLKIALDDRSLALKQYADLLSKGGNSTLADWLNLLANNNKYEIIELDSSFDQSDLFMEICSNTFGNKHELLVGSKQNFKKYPPMTNSSVSYKGVEIYLLDTIDALNALENKGGVNIGSVYNSSITESGDIHNKSN